MHRPHDPVCAMKAQRVQRRYIGTWRETIYERADGSRFHVAIPAMTPANPEGPTSLHWDDGAEAEMIVALMKPRAREVAKP